LIRRACDRQGCGRVHALAVEALARQASAVIVAEAADVARFQPKPRTSDERRGDLAAGLSGVPLHPLLRVARRVLGDDDHRIDAVFTEAGAVDRPGPGGW